MLGAEDGDYSKALRFYGEALSTAREVGKPAESLRAKSHASLGVLLLTLERLEEAYQHLTFAIDLTEVKPAMDLRDEAVKRNARVGAELKVRLATRTEDNHPNYAEELLKDARAIFEHMNDPHAQEVRKRLQRLKTS